MQFYEVKNTEVLNVKLGFRKTAYVFFRDMSGVGVETE